MNETAHIRDQKAVTAALRRGPGVSRDPVVGGLMLVVGRRKASWQLSYIPHGLRADGKRHGRVQMAIGDAMLMSLPQARAEARSLKAAIAKGEDPHRQRRAAKVANALERANAPTTLAEAAAAYALDLSRRATPSLATRKQESPLLQEGSRAHGRRKPARQRTWRRADPPAFARDERLAERGRPPLWRPVAVLRLDGRGADRRREPLRRHPAQRQAQAAVQGLHALHRRDSGPCGPRPTAEEANVRDVIHLLILAPLRLREMTGLRWGEVDLVNGWLRIPAARMKAGVAHDMPLSDEARAILRRRLPPSPKPDDLVFPSSRNKPLDGWSRVIGRIRKALGQSAAKNPDDPTRRAEAFTWHDLRRSFGTHFAGQFDEHLLNLMLAHKPASRAGAGAAYLKATRMKERPAVMAAWAALVLDKEPDGTSCSFLLFGRNSMKLADPVPIQVHSAATMRS